MKWVGFIVIISLQIMSYNVQAEEADCGLPNVEVKYEHLCDATMACEGISRALGFFEKWGYSSPWEIKIEFLDNVYVEKINNGEMDIIKLQAFGYYCGLDGVSRITSWPTMRDEQRKIFGKLNLTKGLFISLIAHEISHCIYHHIFQLNSKDMEQPLTEFVSYIVQIETMENDEKFNVLNLYPEAAFTSILEINSLTYSTNPHKFGVMSYRFFKKIRTYSSRYLMVTWSQVTVSYLI